MKNILQVRGSLSRHMAGVTMASSSDCFVLLVHLLQDCMKALAHRSLLGRGSPQFMEFVQRAQPELAKQVAIMDLHLNILDCQAAVADCQKAIGVSSSLGPHGHGLAQKGSLPLRPAAEEAAWKVPAACFPLRQPSR